MGNSDGNKCSQKTGLGFFGPRRNSLNNNRISKTSTEINIACNHDSIVLIDIKDAGHFFAAFFIGMKSGPLPYVKRRDI